MKSRHATVLGTSSLAKAVQTGKDKRLEASRKRISEELKDYPKPMPIRQVLEDMLKRQKDYFEKKGK